MDDTCLYQIDVRGQVDKDDLNATSPLHLTVVQTNANTASVSTSTQLTVRTDQSGLIGLLRHLHARGLVFLSIQRE